MSGNPWLIRFESRPIASLRILCFPYAGAGASIFRKWTKILPERYEVCVIQLPGRESRRREPPRTDLCGLAEELADVLSSELEQPYVFFGHSLGALLAFELIRELRRRSLPSPVHFFASGREAPRIPESKPPIAQLPDERFIVELRTRYDGIPEAVLAEPELLEIFIPILRADFLMLETYTYQPEASLEVPITALRGEEERDFLPEELAAWGEETDRHFQVRILPGGHFFLNSHPEPLLQVLQEDLIDIDAFV